MASNSAISIVFSISEDANGLKRITADAAEFRKAMQEAVYHRLALPGMVSSISHNRRKPIDNLGD